MNEIHFDFEAILTLATLLTIVPWFYIKFKYKKSDQGPEGVGGHLMGFAYSFFPVFFFVLLIRTFVFEPFRIPSSSMMPTLLTGDFIVVNKYSYGLKLPVLHDTLIEIGHPQRGDVIVFRYPPDQSKDYIKRVVGVPGDDVFYDERTKHVYINGQLIEQETIGVYEGFLDDLQARSRVIEKSEKLGDQPHRMLTINGVMNHSFNYTQLTVPEGHYFVMGDNRDNSADSRYWGLVPERNLVGRAEFIWMHWRIPHFWEGLQRIGTKII